MRVLIHADNATVGVASGRIVDASGRFDIELDVSGELRPGLINCHDHLHRNHYGRLGSPPYPNAYAWGSDIHRTRAEAIARGRALPRRAALLRGAWKNLLAGVTTVVHHDRWEQDFERDFPLRVARVANAHSLGIEPGLDPPPASGEPFALHLAEGIDEVAAAEIGELERRALLGPDLLGVHIVGPDAEGVRRFRASGAAVVWCPTSNFFLFGRTAPADLLAPGVDVLLGSDSRLTGAGTLLTELRAARHTGLLSDRRLEDAVGAVAARRLHLPAPSLASGAPADLAVFRRPIFDADPADVLLVMVGGRLRVMAPELTPALGRWSSRGSFIRTEGATRWVDQGSMAPRTMRQLRRA